MFHRLITKYGLATHLALLASLPLALAPFLPGRTLAVVILWLSAFASVWLFLEPSILAGEHLSQSRARVRHDIFRDPVFWFFLLAVLFAAIRWWNSGIAVRFDAEHSSWFVAKPMVEWLPASVPGEGFLPFAVVLGCGILSLGVLHGIGLAARVSFGLQLAFLMGLGGIAAVTCACLEMQPFLERASAGLQGGPFYGTYHGVGLVIALVCGVQAECRKWAAARLPFCLAVAGNGGGLLFFSPPLVSSAYFVASIAFALFGLAYLSRVGSLGGVARSLTMILFGLALPVFAMMAFAPEQIAAAKSSGLDLQHAFSETYRQMGEALTRMARAMWRSAPWCGVGEGAFRLQVPFLADKADWAILPPRVSMALNGYWTVLAERGILGAILLFGGVATLLVAWVRHLVGGVLYLRTRDDADIFLFACAPVVWTAPFLLALVGAEAVCSSVFSLGPVLLAIVACLALSAASFPRRPKSQSAESDKEN